MTDVRQLRWSWPWTTMTRRWRSTGMCSAWPRRRLSRPRAAVCLFWTPGGRRLRSRTADLQLTIFQELDAK